jgi:L,D-transpeptidase YbiS
MTTDETPAAARPGDAARAPAPRKPAAAGRLIKLLLKLVLGLAVLAVLAFGGLVGAGFWIARQTAAPALQVPDDAATLEKENAALRKKIEKLQPKGQYIVIDTARNRLYLRDGAKVVREAVVSCGSGGVLQDPNGKKTWVFDTPRGERIVKSKVKNPTWIKPDWAFIEEGEAIPKKYDDRAEEGVMGDYALGMGDGYFIHGTLYKRLLGRNVSHGCVRVGDEDLEFLYKTVPLGTKVYIF